MTVKRCRDEVVEAYVRLSNRYFGGRHTTKRIRYSKQRPGREREILFGTNWSAGEIRLHPVLGQKDIVPDYVFEHVLFHEMLHSVCPPVDGSGSKRQIHHRWFNAAEETFPRFEDVLAWEKTNWSKYVGTGKYHDVPPGGHEGWVVSRKQLKRQTNAQFEKQNPELVRCSRAVHEQDPEEPWAGAVQIDQRRIRPAAQRQEWVAQIREQWNARPLAPVGPLEVPSTAPIPAVPAVLSAPTTIVEPPLSWWERTKRVFGS